MRNEEKKYGKKQSQKSAEEPERDTRFDIFGKNPIYRRVPKDQKKIQIDSRFKSMFHNDQFKLTYKVDKRGRPINTTTNENLKKYYKLKKGDDNDDDDEKSESSDTETLKTKNIKSKKSKKEVKSSVKPSINSDNIKSESSDTENQETEEKNIKGNILESEIRKKNKSSNIITKTIKKKLHDLKVDYARGEGDFISEESESEDSSSSEEEDETADISHAWGELDKDAPRTEESTSRLALCNMDWDRVKAVDLMVLFHSFLPTNGVLKCVKIYPSEFGKTRLADEEIHGPQELRVENELKEENISGSDSEDDNVEVVDEDDEEGSSYHMEKLRKYQLNRLKYFYALLEFDSAETADKVYKHCDGMEYESSATLIDLRFVPDDMEFKENDIKDQCDKLADAVKYRPRFFTTTALQQAKVDLTWDETDPLRKELTERVHNPKETVDDEDIRIYLASSSEDEDEDIDNVIGEGSDADTVSNVDPMAKYRALLESIEDTEKIKKQRDVEMEITWGVGLKAKTESMVKDKLEKEAAAKMTPWETILAKKKEKLKKKKQNKKKTEDGNGDDDEQPFSDDEVDVDLDDPFFENELQTNKKQRNSKADTISSKPNEKIAGKAALELLVMDDEDHKQHFNIKNIIEQETASKSKKKKWKKKDLKNKINKKNIIDNFEVDVADDRFSALFSSHLFNVDPSDSNFKNTKAMKTIVKEKQKRRIASTKLQEESKTEELDVNEEKETEAKKSKKDSSELSFLVKSIQRNTSNLKTKQKIKPNKKNKGIE